jgi:hypothetical protein
MLMTKEELAVEVAEVYGIQINDMNLSEASQDEVLQKFTSDATGSNHEDFGLNNASQ